MVEVFLGKHLMRNTHAFIPFQSRSFLLFWIGFFTSQLAVQIHIVSMSWHLYSLTKSPAMLGFFGLANFVPVLFFSVFGGILADKVDRKKILVIAQSVRSLGAIILVIGAFSNSISPAFLYTIAALQAALSAFDLPARQSLLPHVIDRKHLLSAVSLNTVARETSIIVGPTIAGVLLDVWGVQGAYIFAAVTAIIGAFVLMPMKVSHQFIAETASFTMSSFLEGIHFVWKSPLILGGMLLDFLATFFSSATVLLPIFAREILGTSISSIGLLYASPAVGAVVSGIVFSSFKHVRHQGKLLIGAVILYGCATIGFGLSTSFLLSCFFLFFTGVGDMISTIIRNTIRQLQTPDHLRGRMVAISMVFFLGGPQLGEAEAGFAAALIGVPLSVALGGFGTIVGTLLLVAKIPKLWQYEAAELKSP